MRKIVIYLAVLAGTSGAMAQTVALSRTEAVRLALERNEAYQSALLEKDRVRGRYLEARSGALPRVTLDGAYLRNIDMQTSVFSMKDEDGTVRTTTITFGTPHNYSFGFSLYQPLYVAGKVGAALKIAGYGDKYTEAAITAARQNVSTQADRAYLDAVAARQAEKVFREAEHLTDSNLAVVKKLFEQGQASEFDFLRAQVQAANARPERIAAENRTRLAFDYLRNFLALPSDREITVDSAIEQVDVPVLDAASLLAEALANRPELTQSQQQMNINKKLISISSSGYRPNIGISSRIAWDSFKDEFKRFSVAKDSWHRSWNVSLALSWSVFDGFETVGKVRQAKVDYNQSKLANSQLVRQVHLEVQDALGKVNEANQRVEALGETVAQAERGLQIAQVRFQNGIGIQLEVLDAQVALTTARVNRIAALHDLAAAVSALRRAVGREWAPQW